MTIPILKKMFGKDNEKKEISPLPENEKQNADNQEKIKEGMKGQRIWAKLDVGVLNQLISSVQNLDKGKISDGLHTFEDLYTHRNALFIALANHVSERAWRSEKQSDGVQTPGWFLLGINKKEGEQSSSPLLVYSY